LQKIKLSKTWEQKVNVETEESIFKNLFKKARGAA
jgi:hypothetical protein